MKKNNEKIKIIVNACTTQLKNIFYNFLIIYNSLYCFKLRKQKNLNVIIYKIL